MARAAAAWRRRWDAASARHVPQGSEGGFLDPAGPIVSMTTHGDRISLVHQAIASIGAGTVKPSRLLLWVSLPPEQWPQRLLHLQQSGLEIRQTADVGPHTKYWPALSLPDVDQVPLVTADDDITYPTDWLEGLVVAHRQLPDVIHAYRAYQVRCRPDGQIAPYAEWAPCESTEASPRHFATGVSGVIYPPAFLARLRQEGDRFLALCPKADDVWLHAMAVKHGFAVKQVGARPVHFPLVPGTQGSALMAANVGGQGNDIQIAATYGQAERLALSQAPPVGPQDDDGCFTQRDWMALLLRHGLPAGQRPQWLTLHSVQGEACAELGCLAEGRHTLTSLANFYSPLWAPSWQDPSRRPRIAWSRLTRELAGLRQAAVLRWQPLAADRLWWRDCAQALRDHGYATSTYRCFGNWYLPLAVGVNFEGYWQSRPARLRNTVERARRKLLRSHAMQVEVLQEPGAALDDAIAAYERVYAGSWKPKEAHPGFMPALIRWAAQRQALRLGLMRLDGEVVAAQVWLVAEGKAHIYKLAYLPGHEKLSVGSVLTAALMAHVIDQDRVHEVDYLMGDDAYKQDWMTHRRERIGLLACRKRSPAAWWPWLKQSLSGWRRRWRGEVAVTAW